MPKSYYPFNDPALETWLENLSTVMSANLAVLGISQEDYDALVADIGKFSQGLTAHVTAQAAAKAATETKDKAKEDVISNFSVLVNKIQVDPNIPDSLREELGIPVHDKIPSDLTPYPPTDLKAEGFADGTNKLNWKKGENKPGCLYVIEAMIGEATAFATVDVVTATKYDHQKQTPGMKAIYRVRAKRKDLLSSPSNEAAIYSD